MEKTEGKKPSNDVPVIRNRRRSLIEPDHMGELNLVPYLDIMVNLIMFLLISVTASVTLGMINVSAPSSAPVGVSQQKPEDQKKPEKPPLNLTIAVNERGFYIGGSGGILGREKEEGEATAEAKGAMEGDPTIPKLSNGEYDYDRLTEAIARIKAIYPKETKAIIAADPLVTYDIVVKVMDAIREKGEQLLFYDILLSAV